MLENKFSDEKQKIVTKDFDEVFQYISKFGLYQKILVYFIIFPFGFATGMHMFNVIFMVETPDYWCKISDYPGYNNFTIEKRRNISLSVRPPFAMSPQCVRYKSPLYYEQSYLINSDAKNVVSCTEWEFDKSQYYSTIITDWQLVCKPYHAKSIILTIQQVGGLIGSFMYGFIQDKFGRKKTMTICISTITCLAFILSFSPNIYAFGAFRFLISMEILPILETSMTLGVEWVAPDKHSLIGVGINVLFAIGALTSTIFAYLIRSWKYFSISCSVPLLFLFINCWILPETPRWLLTQGRIDEAELIFRKVAEKNKKTLPPDFKNILKKICKNDQSHNVWHLVKTPNMRKKSLTMFFIWLTSGAGYLGYSYYVNDIAGNPYFNYMLATGTEIPAYSIFLPITEKWGRRWPLFFGYLLAVLLAYVYYFIPAAEVTARIAVFIGAKFFMTGIFTIIYSYSGEIFPTVVRGIGSGISIVSHYLGYIVIPAIIALEPKWPGIPVIIMATINLLGVISVIFLPETHKAKLPDTIEEGELFGKNETIKDALCCRLNKTKYDSSNQENMVINGRTVLNADLQTITANSRL